MAEEMGACHLDLVLFAVSAVYLVADTLSGMCCRRLAHLCYSTTELLLWSALAGDDKNVFTWDDV